MSIENENDAIDLAKRRRAIMPKIYSESKNKRAKRHNYDLNMLMVDNDDDEDPNIDEEKQRAREIVDAHMKVMNKMYIDLTKEEIDVIQDILDEAIEGKNYF